MEGQIKNSIDTSVRLIQRSIDTNVKHPKHLAAAAIKPLKSPQYVQSKYLTILLSAAVRYLQEPYVQEPHVQEPYVQEPHVKAPHAKAPRT
jgi:hypothetical protein